MSYSHLQALESLCLEVHQAHELDAARSLSRLTELQVEVRGKSSRSWRDPVPHTEIGELLHPERGSRCRETYICLCIYVYKQKIPNLNIGYFLFDIFN